MHTLNPDMVGLMLEAFEPPLLVSRRGLLDRLDRRDAHENELVAQAQLDDLLDALHGIDWIPRGNGRWTDSTSESTK